MTETKNENIEIRISLKDVPSELWDKVEVDNDWDREYGASLPNQIGLPIMFNWPGSDKNAPGYDKRFKTKELLDGFKKYANGEEEFYVWSGTEIRPKIKDIPSDCFDRSENNLNKWHSVSYSKSEKKLTQYLRDANKLFIKDGYGKTTSKEAFEFLQSIVESLEIKATIKLTKEGFEQKEKENKDQKNQIEELLEKVKNLENELKTEKNDADKLKEDIAESEAEINSLSKENKNLQDQIQQLKAQQQVELKSFGETSGIFGSKLLTLKDVLVRTDLKIFLKEDKTKIEQKEVYWDEVHTEVEESKMEAQVDSWLKDLVDTINQEVNNYGGEVKRERRNGSHQRGHYFIFYNDGTNDQWLALYPWLESDKVPVELAAGHTHKTFILEFDKPVRKFVDVYTCIGCGAQEESSYDDLHANYRNSNSDSWDTIHKGLRFEPWYEEFITLKRIPRKGYESTNFHIASKSGKILGDELDVWQGVTIEDSRGKTFDKAYGYIDAEGNLEWKLERSAQGVKENEQWAIGKVDDHINSLWENKDFAGYQDKSACQQAIMYSLLEKHLNEKEYLLRFKYSGGEETLKINDLLEKIAANFKELISAKKASYQFLEKWSKKSLDGATIREVIKDEELIALKDKPQVIRKVWEQQVRRFIEEDRAKEFYSAQHREGLTWNDAQIKINWLYEEVRDNLDLANQEFAAQVEVLPKK